MAETPADAERLAHASQCEACAALLNRHRRLEDGLRSMAAEIRHTEAPTRVEQALVAAFRCQNRMSPRLVRPHWWVPALSWAAAAGVLIMAALFLLHPHQPLPAHRSAPGAVEMASLAYSGDADSDSSADEFIPLPNASQIDPNEDVNVVRMEVPRSAMLEVGLAVSADRVSELVEADVAFGQDGVARAIRFVDESM
jgi:anti-sigma factor RsiW